MFGDAAVTAEPTSDLSDTANSYHREQEILKRYRGELQGLVPMGAGTGITRLSCWSPASPTDRPELTQAEDFALSLGIPSGLSPLLAPESPATGREALDYAVAITVPGESDLPRGPLYLEGVPLVVRIIRPGSLTPMKDQRAAPLTHAGTPD